MRLIAKLITRGNKRARKELDEDIAIKNEAKREKKQMRKNTIGRKTRKMYYIAEDETCVEKKRHCRTREKIERLTIVKVIIKSIKDTRERKTRTM